jgi:DNA-binding PadR family transcriptional regulator
MDVLEALGGWSNINREKLDQIKVDNPPLYNAISKALNLLAKKFGGEDIIIQKPIEVVDKKPTTIRIESDYAFLKRMEILTLTKVNAVTTNNIVRSIMNEVDLGDDISLLKNFESYVQEKLDDLEAKDLVSRVVGSIYKITNAGQELINSYELQNKQVEELTPSDEDLKLEILLRMADYYDGGVYKLLNQDDIIKYAVKHTFSIPSNKYFGLVVKLLGDGFVEKDPSGDTDSIRLTNQGYDKAMNWFEENLPEEGIPTTPPSTQLTDLQISILEGVKEASETKVGDGFVTINEIWGYNRGVKPNYYSVFATAGQSTPSLEKDLELLYAQGYLEFLFAGIGVKDYTYRLSQKGIDFLNDLKSQATTQLSEEDRYMNILKIIIIYKTKFAQNPNLAESYKEFRLNNVVPITYEIVDMGNNNPNFLADLSKLNDDGLIEINYDKENSAIYEVTLKGKTMLQNYLEAKGQFNDFISEIEVLSTQSKTNQPTSTPAQLEEEPTQGLNYRRPSPTFSATKYATGVTMVGNDMSLWRVTENKNGVKRWVKVGEPTPAIEEPPISEIEEDEVDLDILEQQLNDDSLEFDISDEDLDNLEF